MNIDMFRLKSLVHEKVFNDYHNSLLDNYGLENIVNYNYIGNVKYWENFNFKAYRYNFTYSLLNGSSFYFAYKHNAEKVANYHSFVLEYNPNKAHGFELDKLIKTFFTPSRYVKDVQVVSCDICHDIPLNITNFIFDKGLKREYAVFGSTGDDVTYYAGKGHGRVKLYNKKNEYLKHDIKIEGELTRIEVSLKINLPLSELHNYVPLCSSMPSVKYFNNNIEIDVKTRVMILGLMQEPNLLNLLPRDTKTKLKKILDNQYSFRFDDREVVKTINDFVNSNIKPLISC